LFLNILEQKTGKYWSYCLCVQDQSPASALLGDDSAMDVAEGLEESESGLNHSTASANISANNKADLSVSMNSGGFSLRSARARAKRHPPSSSSSSEVKPVTNALNNHTPAVATAAAAGETIIGNNTNSAYSTRRKQLSLDCSTASYQFGYEDSTLPAHEPFSSSSSSTYYSLELKFTNSPAENNPAAPLDPAVRVFGVTQVTVPLEGECHALLAACCSGLSSAELGLGVPSSVGGGCSASAGGVGVGVGLHGCYSGEETGSDMQRKDGDLDAKAAVLHKNLSVPVTLLLTFRRTVVAMIGAQQVAELPLTWEDDFAEFNGLDGGAAAYSPAANSIHSLNCCSKYFIVHTEVRILFFSVVAASVLTFFFVFSINLV
jgi:hypothetical protein